MPESFAKFVSAAIFLSLSHAMAVQAQSKQVIYGLTVEVTNEFGTGMNNATLVLGGIGDPITNSESEGEGVYRFTVTETGDYTLTATNDFFVEQTAAVEIDNVEQSVSIVLVLDVAQRPNEVLDDFRDIDADLNGAVSEAEFTTRFPAGRDAYITIQDGCTCSLTARDWAVFLDRPFLTLSPTKSRADEAFPTGVIDFGLLEEGRSSEYNLRIANEGGGVLVGSVDVEMHGQTDIAVAPSSYMLAAEATSTLVVSVVPAFEDPEGVDFGDTASFSGILMLDGNYDGASVPLGVQGQVIRPEPGGEGEGEGEGEGPGCPIAKEENAASAASTGVVFTGIVMLLSLSNRISRRKRLVGQNQA